MSAPDDAPFPLERADLLRFENLISQFLRGVITFSSHSLHFPRDYPQTVRADTTQSSWKAAYLPDETRLLLPLVHQGMPLGLFNARGVNLTHPAVELPLIFRVGQLCLQNLILYKRGHTDSMTGLANREGLLQALVQEIELILTCIRPGDAPLVDCPVSGYRANFGLLMLQINDLERINSRFGFALGSQVIVRAGEILCRLSPDNAQPSRIGGNSFAILLPQATPRNCRRLGESLCAEIAGQRFPLSDLDEDITTSVSIGFANYPQDLLGWQLRHSPGDQCLTILGKARHALRVARRNPGDSVYSFRDVIARGGRVTDVLPMHRLTIDLGKGTGLMEGQRLLVWPDPSFAGRMNLAEVGHPVAQHHPVSKGEVQVMEVLEETAVAEILQLNDPAWSPEVGDRLTPVHERDEALLQKGSVLSGPGQGDLPTGLFSFRDFLRLWSRSRQDQDRFSLVMVQMEPPASDGHGWATTISESFVQDVLERAFQAFGPEAVGGRFSTSRFIFFVPGRDQTAVVDLARRFIAVCQGELDVAPPVGVAGFPYLGYSRADVLDNCKKALEHALHEPDLKLAGFGSVSLNINADRLFTHGDLYSAITEYKAALLADPDNLLARNSFGICLARLGLLVQAKQEFTEILHRSARDLMALYNYGCICLRLMENDAARISFEQCLEQDPGHVFSLLRLGQMEEQAGDLDKARMFYVRAAALKNGAGLSQSHLARVTLLLGDVDGALEGLHKALVHNPMDTNSLYLMAKLYLERGEDPEIAESLARKCTSSRPDNGAYWEILALSLDARGKTVDAAVARERARRNA